MGVDLEDDVQVVMEKDYGYTCGFRTAETTSSRSVLIVVLTSFVGGSRMSIDLWFLVVLVEIF